jgi:predicted DNA-binding protein
MSRTKVSTTIYVTPEQSDRLKLLHERTKVPVAVYIREGIDMVLKHYEHVLPGQMTLVRDGVASDPKPLDASSTPKTNQMALDASAPKK